MTETIGKVRLNLEYYEGEDLYSDGDVENELLEIVKNHKPEEYVNLIWESCKWPYLYHLSEQRANIIDWFPFREHAEVFEVGAGCGAITTALVKKAETVVANDLSKRRSSINAWRNQHAENLEIIVGNFNTVAEQLNRKFDYVTLIGVYEYAESYIQEENPYSVFLNKINGLLKDDGEILIAIENRLGLKYFAGCKEDHKGIAYEGIEGYPNTRGVRTFSKAELEKIFQKNGFEEYEFYYPYPDYKFPTTIYSDQYLPSRGDLVQNTRNFDADRFQVFDENKAFDGIIDSGYFPIFSNSFFIRLKKKGQIDG